MKLGLTARRDLGVPAPRCAEDDGDGDLVDDVSRRCPAEDVPGHRWPSVVSSRRAQPPGSSVASAPARAVSGLRGRSVGTRRDGNDHNDRHTRSLPRSGHRDDCRTRHAPSSTETDAPECPSCDLDRYGSGRAAGARAQISWAGGAIACPGHPPASAGAAATVAVGQRASWGYSAVRSPESAADVAADVVGQHLVSARLDAVEGEVGDGGGVRLRRVDAGGHVGVHVPDVQPEHLGVLAQQLLAQSVGQRPSGGLARAVDGGRRPADPRQHRQHVDDRPAAVPGERRVRRRGSGRAGQRRSSRTRAVRRRGRFRRAPMCRCRCRRC